MLLDEIFHLLELSFDWLVMEYWFLFPWWINCRLIVTAIANGTGRFEPASTIILVTLIFVNKNLSSYYTELFWLFFFFFEVLFVPIHLRILWSHSELPSNKFDNGKKQTGVVDEKNFCQLLFESLSSLKIEALPHLILSWKAQSIIKL